MRYRALDGLRGIAAYIVVVSHFSNLTNAWGGRLGHGAGKIGVMLFFLISGYLMGALHLDRLCSLETAIDFIKHRTARIFPLYFAVVFISFAITEIFGYVWGIYPIDASNIWDHIFLLKGIWVLWSIPIEVCFYALFLALWAGASFVSPTVFVTLLAASAAVAGVYDSGEKTTLLYYVHFFLWGLLVSVAQSRGMIRKNSLWTIVLAVTAVTTIIMVPRISNDLFGRDFGLWHNPLLIVGLTAMLIAALGSPFADSYLGSRVASFFGEISYSVYLLHMPVLLWLSTIFDRHVFLFAVSFLSTITVAAWLSNRLIERPCRRYINAMHLNRFSHLRRESAT